MVNVMLYRAGAGTYDGAGKWIPGVVVAENLRILEPQPAPGEFLKLLAEGEDHSKFLSTAISSAARVQAGSESLSADEILWNGERYEIFDLGRWGRYGGFDKAIIKRK